jgi:endonuclease/exonuclease/phosphatase family metal-dependent hydrolase
MKLVLLVSCIGFIACTTEPQDTDPQDDENAGFDIGKADGCLGSPTEDDARGVLVLANDPAVSVDELDDAGVFRKTAQRIVDNRPYADLAALDAVPFVGPFTCRALRDHACNTRGLCERPLDLWTWNIEHFPLTAAAIPDVAAQLAAGPEIVGFEEVDTVSAFDQMRAQLPATWDAAVGATGFDTRVAIAYRRDRLTLQRTETLFPNDSFRFPRPPLALTFSIKGRAGDLPFTVVAVHLKAEIDTASRERRRQAVVALEQWLAGKRAAGERVVVVGDWNDDIDAPADRNVFLPLLNQPDAYTAVTLDVAQRHEFSYIPFRRLIDHIVFTHELGFSVLAADPVKLDEGVITDYKTTVSDHRPVHALLVPVIPAASAAEL